MKWLDRLLGRTTQPVSLSQGTSQGFPEPRPLPDQVTPFPAEPLRVASRSSNPMMLSPLTLAYLGDSVYELFVRSRLIERGHVKVGSLHKAAVGYVRASAQARTLAEIHQALSEDEQDVVRRGRNAKSHAPPKGTSPAEYAAATAFETLLGFLYLAGREERLAQVLEAAARQIEE